MSIDREALAALLHELDDGPECDQYRPLPGGHSRYQRHADRVIAHLSAQPVEGEVEWEYGVRYLNHPAGDTVFPTPEQVARDLAEESNGGVIAMHRKTHRGPWTEVQP